MKVHMLENKLFDSIFLLQPTIPILCTTINEDGTDHIAPFSWINPVSHRPPRVALALMNSPQKQCSLKNIERTGEFVINIPSLNIVDQLVGCSYKAKPGENKFDRSGFTRLKSQNVKPCGVVQCKAHLECKLFKEIILGDHTLVVGDIVHATYDDQAYETNLLIKLDKFKPAIHVFGYDHDNSQIHQFLNIMESQMIEVAYPDDD